MPRGYRLISGKRRVKAAVRAGETRISAVIVDCTAKDAAAVALVENMCRDELDCVEQAEAIEQMIERGGMTQKEAARRLSLSEAAISLKLKILLLDEQQRNFASENGLTERHLRAIMRLPRDKWDEALWECAGEKQSVAACEREVESRIRRMADPLCRHPVIKDVRIFFNTIERAVDVMRSSGIEAMASRRDSADYIEYTIKIPVRKPTENKK